LEMGDKKGRGKRSKKEKWRGNVRGKEVEKGRKVSDVNHRRAMAMTKTGNGNDEDKHWLRGLKFLQR